MSSFTFETKDILNSRISTNHYNALAASYATRSTAGQRGRKTTVLSALHHGASGPLGVIYWQHKMFEVEGQQRRWALLKAKSGGLFSSSREWYWSGQRYTVKYRKCQWIAMSHSSRTPSAVFKPPLRSTTFSKAQPAFLTFSPDVSPSDKTFLILVFLYSELKRQEDDTHMADLAETSTGL